MIPTQQIVRDALALEREKDNFFGWLSYSRYFNLAYEDIGSGKADRRESMRRLCRYLELSGDPANLSSSHEKVSPPLKNIVDNFTELRQTAIQFGQGRLMRPTP